MVLRVPATWETPVGVAAVVDHWLRSNRVKPCLTADSTLAGREASHRAMPSALPAALRGALAARGIEQLYSHQEEAFLAARRAAQPGGPRAVVVATPTASGKSLCFHLPVLTNLVEDPDAHALYIYPTKALARDQEAGLLSLMKDAGIQRGAIVYDGDTPGDARRSARDKSSVLITNPDMIHAGILPQHVNFARILQNLRYVVVDELHAYRGVFGSHVGNLLRRLKRIANFHGSDPIFLSATATIANPKEHAARLFGVADEDVHLVAESGAPTGSRRFFSYNPPVVNAELGIRASYMKQAVGLAADLVRARVPTLVFGQSRNTVERMLRYLRERVGDSVPRDAIVGYRGGYLPGERRAIEERLRNGEILAVVATNALELGIDIGGLDAVVCAGYPGSIASLWQRFGRAGRAKQDSIAVLVTSSAPLDQYLAREPEYLLSAGVEEARIDPHNIEVLVQHLKCAAFELPFEKGEAFGTLPAEATRQTLDYLVQNQVLFDTGKTYRWADAAYPANHVSLRSVGWDNVVIVDLEHDKTIAEIDFRGAHTMVHEQAIYQHDGETWQVERFDYENHKAFVKRVDPDYFTDAMTYVQVKVLDVFDESHITLDAGEAAETGYGEVALVEKVVGYKKVKFQTHENAGYGEVRLPELSLHTTAFWLTLPESYVAAQPEGRAAVVDSLRGVGRALETVSTLALMCEPKDLGTTLGEDGEPDLAPAKNGPVRSYRPTLFVHEYVPSGIGLAERIHAHKAVLLERAYELVAHCPCPSGCPGCVGPIVEDAPLGAPARAGRKALVLRALAALTSAT